MFPLADARRETQRIMVTDDNGEIACASQVIAYVDLTIGRADVHGTDLARGEEEAAAVSGEGCPGEEQHRQRAEHQPSMDSHEPNPIDTRLTSVSIAARG